MPPETVSYLEAIAAGLASEMEADPDVFLIGEDVGGMAVHIASRVGGLAGAGEVLVSGTVFGTVVGGPFTFEDRGFHELKGVPGRWPLFALGAGERTP